MRAVESQVPKMKIVESWTPVDLEMGKKSMQEEARFWLNIVCKNLTKQSKGE